MPEAKQKPKKPGRPKLPKGTAKAGRLQVRLSPAEQKLVAAAAKDARQSVSEWARSLITAALQVGI